jgi:hypothetical protein
MNASAFSENLVKCMQNDWQLDGKWLSTVLPSLALATSSAMGVELKLDFSKAELQEKSALRTITDAYLKLVKDAKRKRKEGDPWPVIIIDEANALIKWKDEESLDSLLAFFVYLTKQEQLAHVILATSDTFLTQWLESGAPCLELALRLLQVFTAQPLLRSHQRPVPLLVRGGQPDARGGAHVLLRLHLAVLQAPAWRRRGVGARV